jgi:glycosyltransferase involved in cell wall biosynthesis
MLTRTIIEQFDPERPKPGGIDTCIRGLIKYCPDDIALQVVGIDAIGNKRLGQWQRCSLDGREFSFMPVARLDNANLSRLIPHSVNMALGLKRYLPTLSSDQVQTHRINMGAFVLRMYPSVEHIQFLHSSGVDNLGKGSKSFFKYSVFAYRKLEQYVIPRSVDTVVFSQSGATRLSTLASSVRFSPTWYDPKEFFVPTDRASERSKILWACRIEPAKNPLLAVEVINLLPNHYTLTVAGSGTLEEQMKTAARGSIASNRIQFLGSVHKSEMGALMRAHDLLLMTSRFEGYSRSIVEALACGLPVVTTPGGEPNGLIVDGVNGARVGSEEAIDFVRAFEIASAVPTDTTVASGQALSAATIVPTLLQRPFI